MDSLLDKTNRFVLSIVIGFFKLNRGKYSSFFD